MRKIYVDIFYCHRTRVKQAIVKYLREIEELKGFVCPAVVYLNCESLNPSFDLDVPAYRIFSIQRAGSRDVRIVVNLSVKVNS